MLPTTRNLTASPTPHWWGATPLIVHEKLVQERRNSIANALELCLSCTNPSIYKVAAHEGFYYMKNTIYSLVKHEMNHHQEKHQSQSRSMAFCRMKNYMIHLDTSHIRSKCEKWIYHIWEVIGWCRYKKEELSWFVSLTEELDCIGPATWPDSRNPWIDIDYTVTQHFHVRSVSIWWSLLSGCRHREKLWAFTGPRTDFADIKHGYTHEFYWSDSSFLSQCPRTGKFRGVCGRDQHKASFTSQQCFQSSHPCY